MSSALRSNRMFESCATQSMLQRRAFNWCGRVRPPANLRQAYRRARERLRRFTSTTLNRGV